MAYAQKPDFVFQQNGEVHLNQGWGWRVQSTIGSQDVRISSSNAGYTMFQGNVKSTRYPSHSPVSSSPPVHHISTLLQIVKHPIKQLTSCSCCPPPPQSHKHPQLPFPLPLTPHSSFDASDNSTPHAANCVCSEQYCATYFHSTDQRTLAESIPFTMKCVKMSGYKEAVRISHL
jgi:hypothetical protein